MEWMFGLLIILELVLPLPLKDQRGKNRGFPVATTALVCINVLVHIAVLWLRPESATALETVFQTYGVVPDAVLERDGLGALSLITAGFLHSGWLHLAG